MIHKHVSRRFCCEDISKIENYELAKKDNFKGWAIHHRLETHSSEGERRLIDISMKELKALDMYYHRPAGELIFLTRSEHIGLHNHSRKGRHHSEEAKRKIADAMKGRIFSEEWKRKIGDKSRGKHHSEETKRKLAESKRGNKNATGKHNIVKKHWKLVDGKRVWY